MVGFLNNFIKIRKPTRLVGVKILRDLLLIKNGLIIIFGLNCFLKKRTSCQKKKNRHKQSTLTIYHFIQKNKLYNLK